MALSARWVGWAWLHGGGRIVSWWDLRPNGREVEEFWVLAGNCRPYHLELLEDRGQGRSSGWGLVPR